MDALTEFLDKHVNHHAIDNQCIMIKWRGKFIKTKSGKSSWKTKSHAKSALNNHIDGWFIIQYLRLKRMKPDLQYHAITKQDDQEVMDDILKEIEFVEFKP